MSTGSGRRIKATSRDLAWLTGKICTGGKWSYRALDKGAAIRWTRDGKHTLFPFYADEDDDESRIVLNGMMRVIRIFNTKGPPMPTDPSWHYSLVIQGLEIAASRHHADDVIAKWFYPPPEFGRFVQFAVDTALYNQRRPQGERLSMAEYLARIARPGIDVANPTVPETANPGLYVTSAPMVPVRLKCGRGEAKTEPSQEALRVMAMLVASGFALKVGRHQVAAVSPQGWDCTISGNAPVVGLLTQIARRMEPAPPTSGPITPEAKVRMVKLLIQAAGLDHKPNDREVVNSIFGARALEDSRYCAFQAAILAAEAYVRRTGERISFGEYIARSLLGQLIPEKATRPRWWRG